MQRTFAHAVTYTNRDRVSVADVAASLVANERLVREALSSLESLFPGLTIEDVSIVFRRASSDSPLQEAIEAVANVVFQEDITQKVPELISKLTGVDIPKGLDGPVTLIVMGMVAYGIYWAAKRRKKTDADAATTIEGNYNQVIHIGSVVMNVEPHDLRRAIEQRFQGSRSAAISRRALDFIRPAQREEGAAIEGGGVRLEPETIAAAPSAADQDVDGDEEIQEPYVDQEIRVHATDLDSNKTGWAGHLPGLWERRLPMRLYPTIRPEEIFGKRTVRGDIILVSKRGPDGEFRPYIFHVVGLD